MNWKQKAKKDFPGLKPTRPAEFFRSGNELTIPGYDEKVVLVIRSRDLEKLACIIPSPVVQILRKEIQRLKRKIAKLAPRK
jgi:hypothetical protein